MRTAVVLLAGFLSALSWTAPARGETAPPLIGRFTVPYCAQDLAVGADGCVYVCGIRDGLVHKHSSTGASLATIGPVNRPYAVTTGPNGDVFVAESGGQRVSEFTADGAFVRAFGGTLGTSPGEFHSPAGVAVDRQGCVYVADTDNARIQVFGADGAFLAQWPTPGDVPRALAFDAGGRLDVASFGGAFNGISAYATDGTPLGPVWSGGVIDFAVDAESNLLVAGGGVRKYDPSGGTLWSMIFGPVTGTTCPSDAISGLALSSDGRLYVLALGNVWIYGGTGTPTTSPTWGGLKSRYR